MEQYRKSPVWDAGRKSCCSSVTSNGQQRAASSAFVTFVAFFQRHSLFKIVESLIVLRGVFALSSFREGRGKDSLLCHRQVAVCREFVSSSGSESSKLLHASLKCDGESSRSVDLQRRPSVESELCLYFTVKRA